MWAIGMRADRGFTLLELLGVLAILGLVSGLAATAYGGRAERQQERLVTDVAMLLRGARSEAVGSGHAVRIIFADERIAAEPSRRPLRLNVGASARLRWSDEAVAGPHPEATFFPDGSATPGVVEVISAGTMRRIAIDWLGGVSDANAGT